MCASEKTTVTTVQRLEACSCTSTHPWCVHGDNGLVPEVRLTTCWARFSLPQICCCSVWEEGFSLGGFSRQTLSCCKEPLSSHSRAKLVVEHRTRESVHTCMTGRVCPGDVCITSSGPVIVRAPTNLWRILGHLFCAEMLLQGPPKVDKELRKAESVTVNNVVISED